MGEIASLSRCAGWDYPRSASAPKEKFQEDSQISVVIDLRLSCWPRCFRAPGCEWPSHP